MSPDDLAFIAGNADAGRLGLPVEPRGPEHFGLFARFAAADMPASSARTRSLLGWELTGPGLIADLDQPGYYAG